MASRIKNLAKLGLLLGGPVVVLVGLFSCGVYCGHEHRETVLAFERDWLGMDVTVPGQPRPEPPKTEPTKVEPTRTEPTKIEPPKVEPTKTEPTKVEPTKTEPTKVEPTPTVEPVPPVLARVEDPLPMPFPEPAPLSGENAARLADPVRITVKVLVDPGLATRRPDWLAYVQRHVAWGSQVLEKEIGLSLDLQGIVRLAAPVRTPAELKEHADDGADLLLVFVNEAFSVPVSVQPAKDTNLDAMLVHATQGSRAGHLRGLLFAVGQVLGGEVLRDDSEDALAGSWMAPSAVRADDSVPIKLDATNRAMLLAHKTHDFVAPAGATPRPETPPPTVHDEPEAPADEREENP